MTVTVNEASRFRSKERLYGALAKAQGAKLRVLAFDPDGRLSSRSVPAARQLARAAGISLSSLFGEASARIAAHSARATAKAAAYVMGLWHAGAIVRRPRASDTASPSSCSLPLPLLSPADPTSTATSSSAVGSVGKGEVVRATVGK